jgi:hypothetical protein
MTDRAITGTQAVTIDFRVLVELAFRNMGHFVFDCDKGPHHRWYITAELFGLGSTSAIQLCRDFGFDPDEKICGCPDAATSDPTISWPNRSR